MLRLVWSFLAASGITAAAFIGVWRLPHWFFD